MSNSRVDRLMVLSLVLSLVMLLPAMPANAGLFGEKVPLTIQVARFTDTGYYQASDWELTIKFSHPVRLADLVDKLELRVDGQAHGYRLSNTLTGASLDSEATPRQALGGVLLRPDYPVDSDSAAGRACEILIARDLESAKGKHRLAKEWSQGFRVVAPFEILSIEPQADAEAIAITFSTAIRKEALRNKLTVVPPVSLNWYRSRTVGKELMLVGRFLRGRRYRLSLPEGFSSSGSTFAGGELEFTVPDHEPRIHWRGEKQQRNSRFRPLVERDSRQLLHAHLINTEQLLCESLRISPLLLPYTEEFLAPDSLALEMRSIEAELTGHLKGLRHYLQHQKELEPFLRPLSRETEAFFSQAAQNEWGDISLPLSFREHAATGSIELIHLRENRAGSRVDTGLALFRITDLALTYKRSPGEMLVWVTSMATGLPCAKVPVIALDGDGEAWLLGKTNKDGLLIRSDTASMLGFSVKNPTPAWNRTDFDPGSIVTLLAATEDDATFVDLRSATTLVKGETGDEALDESARRALLFTERGIYKPGETVQIKGLLRDFTGDREIVPTQAEIPLQIRDPRRELVYSQTMTCSAFGSIQDSLTLKTWAKLGQYTIQIGENTAKPLAATSFQVQEYRPPRHYCDLRFRQEERSSNDYVNREVKESWLTATAGAHYYAGGPVKHGKLRWEVNASPTAFSVDEYPEYRFGNSGRELAGFLESGEALLDENGELSVSVPLGAGALNGEYGLEFSVTALDFDGRSAAVTSTWQSRPSYIPGITALPAEIRAGETLELRCIVLDRKNRPLRKGSVQLRVLSEEYQYVQKRDAQGNYSWTWREVWIEARRQDLRLTKKGSPIELTFPDWGDYLIELSYTDNRGEVHRSSYPVQSAHPRRRPLVQPDDFPFLALMLDRDEVDPGDRVQVWLRPDAPLASALFCIEREGIFDARLFPLEEGELTFTATEEMEPNVHVSVLGTLPRSEFPRYRQQEDSEAPGFVYGHKELHVRRNSQALSIELQKGPAGMIVEPGERVDLVLKTVDDRGYGLAAEVALGVVDEAVLAMTRWNLPGTGVLLDFDLPLLVTTGDARKELRGQELDRLLELMPLTGGDGALAADALPDSDTGIVQSVRQNFDPVAYFAPALHSDAGGILRVSFRVPDTMTRYRVYALAADQHSRFGKLRERLTVSRQFYLEPGLPRFLTRGDRFQAELAAFNRNEHSGTIDLTLESGPELVLDPAPLGIPVAGNDRKTIEVSGQAVAVGDADFMARAHFGEQQDGVRITLPVHSGAMTDVISRTGVFRREGKLRTTDLALPARIPPDLVDPGSHHARLTLSTSPLLRLGPGLRYLLRYPYGCIEQTSSTLMPLAGLRQLTELGQVPGFDSNDTNRFIAAGIARIYSMQVSSGGFSYWPGGREANYNGSLYALTALMAVADSGHELPQDNMDRALDWLEHELGRAGRRNHQYNQRRAWTLYLLEKAGRPHWPSLKGMLSRMNELSLEARAFTLLAAVESDSIPASELMQLAERYLNDSTGSLDAITGSFRARFRARAVALLAYDRLLPDSFQGRQLAAEILSGMGYDGRWSATSDTGWCLLALAGHAETAEDSREPLQITVRQKGQASRVADLTGMEGAALEFDLASLTSDQEILLSAPTDERVYYSLDLRFPLPHEAQLGRSEGFNVTKRIENLNGSNRIQVGDVVEITLEFSPERRGSLRFLALDDPLPAGLVAINSALATEQVPQDADDRGEDWYWRWRTPEGNYELHPSHYELRDDRVLVFADRLWSGSWQYSYYARAVCAGDFVMAASKVQLMYEPEISGSTPLTHVVIEER